MLQSCPNLLSLSLRNQLEVRCQALTVQAWDWAVSPAVHRCVAAVLMLCLACAELWVPRAAGSCALHVHGHSHAPEHWAARNHFCFLGKVTLAQELKRLGCHLKLVSELVNKGHVLPEGSQGEDVQSINSVIRKPGMAFSGVAIGSPELLRQLKDVHVPFSVKDTCRNGPLSCSFCKVGWLNFFWDLLPLSENSGCLKAASVVTKHMVLFRKLWKQRDSATGISNSLWWVAFVPSHFATAQYFLPSSFSQDCGFSLRTNKLTGEMPEGCSDVIYPARDYELL